jgi:hypothetical protein
MTMLKLTLAGAALLSSLGVPLAHGTFSGPTSPAVVEQKLLHEMNSGPSGKLTQRVDCGSRPGRRFTCELISTRSTRLDARVVVRGGGELQTVWAPLKG